MPSDWDRNVCSGCGLSVKADDLLRFKQDMLGTTPFTLWAVANDTLVGESFTPIWVWYAALRSCQRGIQISDDLYSEFGDRAKGMAAVAQARRELKSWAATQPSEMTLYFTASLGQWNTAKGTFQLQQLGKATTLRPNSIERIYRDFPYPDGATVELWSGPEGQAINHFQASLAAPQCVGPDGRTIYKFEKWSQWWVVFGDARRGMGGLVDYRSRAFLPPVSMSREAAAAFARRNPGRKVEVAVTFAALGSSFVKGTDQPAIRARFTNVTIADAMDGTVLATRKY